MSSLLLFSSGKVAIDWGSSALKIVSAYRFKEGYFITNFAYQEIGDNLSESLSRIWQEKRLPSFNITLCLDGASTLVRVIDFPRMDKKLIRQSLNYELSKYIPFSSEEVYFDFYILDNLEANSENFKLLIASAKKDFVEERVRVLDKAGLTPFKITLSPISLSNAFLKFFPQEDFPVALLDLGFSSALITVVYKSNICLCREIRRGAKDILERISNLEGITLNNFKDLSEKQDKIKPQLILEVCSDLLEELRLSLDYLETKQNFSVKKIYSTGGLTAYKGINEILSKSLGIEVLPFHILKFFRCKDSLKKNLEELEGNFSVSISSLL